MSDSIQLELEQMLLIYTNQLRSNKDFDSSQWITAEIQTDKGIEINFQRMLLKKRIEEGEDKVTQIRRSNKKLRDLVWENGNVDKLETQGINDMLPDYFNTLAKR